MDSADVAAAVGEMLRALGPHVDADWAVPAGELDWSCWTTAEHVAHDLLAYAGQLAGRPADGYLPFDLAVRPETAPQDVLRVVAACAVLLERELDAAGAEARAWHWGPADPGGFAAMGVDEVLVHTWDITRGLGLDWAPPRELCAKVLTRLFTDLPDGGRADLPEGDPAEVLLWATGRIALKDRPRRMSWVMKAAVG